MASEEYSRIESSFIEGLFIAVDEWRGTWESYVAAPTFLNLDDSDRLRDSSKWLQNKVREELGIGGSSETKDPFTNLAFMLVELGVPEIEWGRIAWKLLKAYQLVEDESINPFLSMKAIRPVEQPKPVKIINLFGKKNVQA